MSMLCMRLGGLTPCLDDPLADNGRLEAHEAHGRDEVLLGQVGHALGHTHALAAVLHHQYRVR